METETALIRDYEKVINLLRAQISTLKTAIRAQNSQSYMTTREELMQSSRCQVKEITSQVVNLTKEPAVSEGTEDQFRELRKKIHFLEAENRELKARIVVLESEKNNAIERLYGSEKKGSKGKHGLWAEVRQELSRGFSPSSSINQKIQSIRRSVRSMSQYSLSQRKTPSVRPVTAKPLLKTNLTKQTQSVSRRSSLKTL